MSLLQRFQQAANKAQIQATAFGQDVSRQAAVGSTQFSQSFTLEKECERAAQTLQCKVDVMLGLSTLRLEIATSAARQCVRTPS